MVVVIQKSNHYGYLIEIARIECQLKGISAIISIPFDNIHDWCHGPDGLSHRSSNHVLVLLIKNAPFLSPPVLFPFNPDEFLAIEASLWACCHTYVVDGVWWSMCHLGDRKWTFPFFPCPIIAPGFLQRVSDFLRVELRGWITGEVGNTFRVARCWWKRYKNDVFSMCFAVQNCLINICCFGDQQMVHVKWLRQVWGSALASFLSIHPCHSQKKWGNKATFDRSMAALAEKVRNYGVYVLTIWPGTLVLWWMVDFLKGRTLKGMILMTTTLKQTNTLPPNLPCSWNWFLLNTAGTTRVPQAFCWLSVFFP